MLHRHCIIRILSLCFLAAGIGLAACSDNDRVSVNHLPV